MESMFAGSQFNKNINTWDVSNVTNMSYMFANSMFNNDISSWNVSNVTDMNYMFENSQFNGDISSWKPLELVSLEDMFDEWNKSIPYWAIIDDEKIRNKAIEKYQEVKKLNEELQKELSNENNTLSKKIKI
jgi:surface protein